MKPRARTVARNPDSGTIFQPCNMRASSLSGLTDRSKGKPDRLLGDVLFTPGGGGSLHFAHK